LYGYYSKETSHTQPPSSDVLFRTNIALTYMMPHGDGIGVMKCTLPSPTSLTMMILGTNNDEEQLCYSSLDHMSA